MSYIEFNKVWKEYPGQVVLEQLNATVEEGEFITIVGASGCGKTTFLNMLLGTETHSRGQIMLAGSEITQEPDDSRGIVFQRYSVFPHLSVLENVVIAREFQASPWLSRLFGKARKQPRHPRRHACLSIIAMAQTQADYFYDYPRFKGRFLPRHPPVGV